MFTEQATTIKKREYLGRYIPPEGENIQNNNLFI